MATSSLLRDETNQPIISSSSLDDETISKPFLHGIPAFTSNHQRRRRVANDNPLLHAKRPSFRRDVGHAAAETYLLTRLSFKLLRYLGYSWISSTLFLSFFFKIFFFPDIGILLILHFGVVATFVLLMLESFGVDLVFGLN